VRARQARVIELQNTLSDTAAAEHTVKHYPLSYKDYLHGLKIVHTVRKELRREKDASYFYLDAEPKYIGLAERYNSETHTPDAKGWRAYLADTHPSFRLCSDAMPALPLIEGERIGHTLIVAGAGHGKSELMKALAYHYVETDPKSAAVVVIDPHGSFAREVARWPQFAADPDRLVYIRADLIAGHVPPLNPFYLAKAYPAEFRDEMAAGLARTLTELLPKAELTSNMEMVVRSCARVLLDRPGSTLHDLLIMLGDKSDPRRAELLEAGRNSADPMLADFFRFQFDSDALASSKSGLRNRLYTLLLHSGFRQIICADGCLNLMSMIEKRRVIVFDLLGLGSEERAALGRLVLMMLWSVGQVQFRRDARKLVPTHVFVDEASILAGPAFGVFLKEYRKVGLHLTMAQQVAGDGLGGSLTDSLLANTAIKFAGINNRRDISRLLSVSPEEAKALSDLPRGQFWCKWGSGSELVSVAVRDDLAGSAKVMTDEQWAKLVAGWKAGKLYRPIAAASPAPAARSTTPRNDLPL
jgi:hypothetical protein